MTQPGDQSRVTRRVPRQSGVWSPVSAEALAPAEVPPVDPLISDREADQAVTELMRVIGYLAEVIRTDLPGIDIDNSPTSASADEARRSLERYVRERRANRETIDRGNARIKQLEGEVEKALRSSAKIDLWIDDRDATLSQHAEAIGAHEAEYADLDRRYAQAQAEIVRLTADVDRLTASEALYRQAVIDEKRRSQDTQRLTRTAVDTELHEEIARLHKENEEQRAELDRLAATVLRTEAQSGEAERLRKDNDRLKADVARVEAKFKDFEGVKREIGKVRAERDLAQAEVERAKAAEQKAIAAKQTAVKDYDALKREVGGKVKQPILVIGTSADVAKGDKKPPEELIKLFPQANYASFLIKILEAVLRLARREGTPEQLVEAVKVAKTSELEPFFDAKQRALSFPAALELALSECQSWFTQLMLAFKEKGEQIDALITQRNGYRAELADVDRVVKEASEAIAGLRATLKRGKK